jgi:chromosome segregation and condensation protein ScpB
VTVTFNARHAREAKKVKQLLMEKAIGDVLSVDFHEYPDTSHGADYFRRWHHLKENSGTLLCHKASHHFDQANWWLDSRPVEVTGSGELKFYGRNGAVRGTHCRTCPYRRKCQFNWDVTRNPQYVKLYVECEADDGYLRDACVFRESTNIYDVMSVLVKYENGVRLTYTANTYLPYEGQAISFRLSQKEKITLGLIAQHEAVTLEELSRLLALAAGMDARPWIGKLVDWGLVKTQGRTRGMRYLADPALLLRMKFQGRTTLKGIEPHRLRELVRSDLERYRTASITEIQARIGVEISRREIRRELARLASSGEIRVEGRRRWTRYLWNK